MIKATKEFLDQQDSLYLKRKEEILNTKDEIEISGVTYYVSNAGDDNNDGLSPETSWKTPRRVSSAYLNPGDGVRFKRGDLFRGNIICKPGVTYCAYGEGEKPKFYAGKKDYADPDLWELYDEEHHIWKCKEKMLDSGTLVFNHGECHARKLIPSYRDLKWVHRDDESIDFDIHTDMTEDLDIFWYFDELLSRVPSFGEDFPVPCLNGPSISDTLAQGILYLRCDRGNPGEVFDSIESLARLHMFVVGTNANVRIDNLCIKYVGMHGVSAGGHVIGLQVTNCEFGWIGGAIQNYTGRDPNFTNARRGQIVRFGNAIEVYGGCDDYLAENNYIYEVYDAGITHQISAYNKFELKNVRYTRNLIEKCVYGIEYFLEIKPGGEESYMDHIEMDHNIIRLSGYGWGQQRHNFHTPALIKGWSYENTATNYSIHDNIFDRSAYRMLHLVADRQESCPEMYHNTYIQNIGGMIGQYGGKENGEPDVEIFDARAEEKIELIFCEKNGTVYCID